MTTLTRTTWFRAFSKVHWHLLREPGAVNHRATGLCGFQTGGLGTKYTEQPPANVCRACTGAQG